MWPASHVSLAMSWWGWPTLAVAVMAPGVACPPHADVRVDYCTIVYMYYVCDLHNSIYVGFSAMLHMYIDGYILNL